MADLKYKVGIETQQAQRSLSGLQDSILGIGAALAGAFAVSELVSVAARFENLRSSLGIVFKDVEEGAKAFEQIKAFATQSVFSVEALTETVIKLKSAGLDPTVAQLQLFADVSSVAVDSLGALQAITDLYARTTAGGLGLEDLNRLQDRGIPVFKLLADKAGLARDEISKVGQSAEGAQAILAVLQDALAEQFSGASAAKAETLSQAIGNLKDGLDTMFDTIGQSGFNEALAEAINNTTAFIQRNEELIKVIGEGLGNAIRFTADNAKYLGALLAGVFAAATAGRIIAITQSVIALSKAMKGAAIAGTILQGVTGVGLVKVGVGLAAAAVAIGTIEAMSDDASDNIDGIKNSIDKLNDGPIAPTAQAPKSLDDAVATIEALKIGQTAITAQATQYFDKFEDGVNTFSKRIKQQTELLKLTDDQAEIQRGINQFEQQYLNTIAPLQQKIIDLRAKDTDASKAQAEQIQNQIGLITELHAESISGIKTQLENQVAISNQMERQVELQDALNARIENRMDFQERMHDLVREANHELEDLSLDPFEKELRDINRMLDNELVQAIRNIKSQWEDGIISADEYIAETKKLEAAALKAQDTLYGIATTARETQRSFAYGWRRAFESYEDDATNAAKNAERIFAKTTQGMEDMIVDFAKTGKFEFKSFVASILEDLLRAQIQQSIAQIFQTPMGGGSAGSNLGNIFGGFFANGGFLPSGKVGVVGEAGPELISGPANITPLTGMGGNVTYNINAVDALSFRQMVARDPGFIHAVAQKGGSAVPSGR
jgi:lambda family phage tail tape measure protein